MPGLIHRLASEGSEKIVRVDTVGGATKDVDAVGGHSVGIDEAR